jgi:hypothetical protein
MNYLQPDNIWKSFDEVGNRFYREICVERKIPLFSTRRNRDDYKLVESFCFIVIFIMFTDED